MKAKLQKWLPIALCCLPGVVVAALVGLSLALGGAAVGASPLGSGPLGLRLIALVTGSAVVCPVSMGLMMWRLGQSSALATNWPLFTMVSRRQATLNREDG